MDLDSLLAKPDGHGGKRANAGRPKGRSVVSHDERPDFPSRYPAHVTLKAVPGVNLRRDWLMPTIRGAILDSNGEDYRSVHFNVLWNHVHLVSEAEGRAGLGSGLSGLKVRLAQRLNDRLGRTASLFCERYHSRILKTPRGRAADDSASTPRRSIPPRPS